MCKLKLVIPKGKIYNNVVKLLNNAGIYFQVDERSYRPITSSPDIDIKIMKPQNIPKLVEFGAYDVGFTGYDWIVESKADVEMILDLKFDPVKIVAAIPKTLFKKSLHNREIIVASEYENIAIEFLNKEKYNYKFFRTFGATEGFPPENADMIIDVIATGKTLDAHNLSPIATIMESSTRFIANKNAIKEKWKGKKIHELKILFQSILDARERVILEMNVPEEKLDKIAKILPCMRSPTIALLYGKQGYAVKVAVKKDEVLTLVPLLKKLGATDILEYEIKKIVV